MLVSRCWGCWLMGTAWSLTPQGSWFSGETVTRSGFSPDSATDSPETPGASGRGIKERRGRTSSWPIIGITYFRGSWKGRPLVEVHWEDNEGTETLSGDCVWEWSSSSGWEHLREWARAPASSERQHTHILGSYCPCIQSPAIICLID